MPTVSTDRDRPRAFLLKWLILLRWFIGAGAVLASLVAVAVPGLPWGDRWVALFGVGLTILVHNAVLAATVKQHPQTETTSGKVAVMVLIGVGLDLVGLSILSATTGGVTSPLLTYFAAHVVLAATVFRPWVALAIALAAIAGLAGALVVAGRWPSAPDERLIFVGWAGALIVVALVSAGVAASFRRSERSLLRSERRAEAVLDTTVDGIITINQTGRILAINRAASRLFGYADNELIGEPVSILMPEPDRSRHDGYIAHHLRTGEMKIIGLGREVTGLTRAGERIPIDLAVSRVRLADEALFTGIVRDLRPRKRAEAEVAAARERIEEQNRAIAEQEKLAAIGTLAAGVAHEIANPLAVIDSILQLAQRQGRSLDTDQAATIREQLERIHEVIREITTFARPAGTTGAPLNLGEIAHRTLDLLRFDHRIRRVRVELDRGDGDSRVHANPGEMQQVLLNLLTNALDALAGAEAPRLTLRTRADGDEIALDIVDNGPGVPPDTESRVFDPFYTTKPPGQGTGLGLSISSRLVNRAGGRLSLAPTPGGGATFTVTLPRWTPEPSSS